MSPFHLSDFEISKTLEANAPECATFGIEACGFEGAFDGGIAGVHLAGNTMNIALPGVRD